ncbi:MAG: hypothetical protein WC464_03095 [Bdellovibrionales bacterium]
MGPETFCEDGDSDHHLINIYMYGVPSPLKALAFNNADYNFGNQLTSTPDFELCEVLTDEGRYWVNSKAVLDCVPVNESSDGKARTKLIFEEGMSNIIPAAVDDVKAALKRPVDFNFSFPPPPVAEPAKEPAPNEKAAAKAKRPPAKPPGKNPRAPKAH